MAIQLDSQIAWQQIAIIPGQIPGPLPVGYPAYGPGAGSFALTGGELNTVTDMVFVVDDNSIVALFHGNHQFNGVADVFPYVIDTSGAWTSYAAPSVVNGGLAGVGVTHVDSYSGGNFSLTDTGGPGGTIVWTARFANAKLNNPVPIVLPNSALGVAAPCGEPGPPRTYYDSARGLIAYGFYGTQGQFGGSLSAQTYTVDKTGNQRLFTQGPVGNWNSQTGQDDFDHTGNSGGGRTGILSNGIICSTAGNNSIGSLSVSVLAGSTIGCGPGNKSGIQAIPGPGGQLSYPYFVDNNNDNLVCDCNIPNILGVKGQYVQIFGPGFQGYLSPGTAPRYGNYLNWRIAITRKYMFAVWSQGPFNPGDGNLVYRSVLPAAILSQPSFVGRHSRFAANFARPISLTGRYKA